MSDILTDPNLELEIQPQPFDVVKTVGGVMEELQNLDDQADLSNVFNTAEPLVRLLARTETDGGKKLKGVLDGIIDSKPLVGVTLPPRASLKDSFYLASKLATKRKDFHGRDGVDIQTFKAEVIAFSKEAIEEKKISHDHHLETRLERPYGSPQGEVAGTIFSILRDGQFDDEESILHGVEALGNATSHELFVTRSRNGSFFDKPEYNHVLRNPDIVISSDTCDIFAGMFKSAVEEQGRYYRKSFEKELGYSYEELAFRYVYAHELGHLVGYELSAYGERGHNAWEEEFLYEHQTENLSPHLEDAVTIEKERFAEGIAQAYVAATLTRAGMGDEKLISSIQDAFARKRTEDAEEAYLKLHDHEAPLGLIKYGSTLFRLAANLGYGLPLTWEEIEDRLEFLKSDQYQNPEKRSERQRVIQALNHNKAWKEHVTKGNYDPTKRLFDHQKAVKEKIKVDEASEKKAEKRYQIMKIVGGLVVAFDLLGAGYLGRMATETHPQAGDTPTLEALSSDKNFNKVDIEKGITAEVIDLPDTSQEMIDQAYHLAKSGAETVKLYNITGQKLTIIVGSPVEFVELSDGRKIDLTAQSNELQATSLALKVLNEDPRYVNYQNTPQIIPKIQQKRAAASNSIGSHYAVYEFDLTKLVP